MDLDSSDSNLALKELSSPSHENQKDENEGYFVLAEETDFELLEAHSEHLGGHLPDEPIVDAEENQKIGSLRFLRSSVGVKIQELAWGDLDGKGACRILLEFSIRSSRQFRVEDAYLTCTIAQCEEIPQNMTIEQKERRQPRILRYHPRDASKFAKGDAGTEIVDTLVMAPELTLPSGLGLKIGSWTRQKTYSPVHGLEVSGDANFDVSETILWSVSNRSAKDRHFTHDVEAELLVEHHDQDFCGEFEIEAKLDFGTTILTLGQSRTVRKRRNFKVVPSVVKFK
jgi:hypothetical protein